MGKKYKYIGPDYDPWSRLHAYGREIAPKAWSPEEIEKWLEIEPRYKAFFEEVDAVKGDAAKEKVKE
jgi:hypothetical protein